MSSRDLTSHDLTSHDLTSLDRESYTLRTMEEFIGRAREIRALDAAYASERSAFIPIYGRRRVGKSELILHWLQGKPGIYFFGKKAQASLQIREFLTEAAAVLGEPLLATFPAEGWKAAIEAVMTRWGGPGSKGASRRGRKLVLAFDEFQWTAEASPELPSVLQELWDRRWRDRNDVVLILCGSYIGFMEREVLGKKSPLFGRRTAQILLQPFDQEEAALFHPSCSLVERAKIYFVCGGIPLYLRRFDPRQTVATNIIEGILDPLGPLHHEPDFLLREELREVETYYAVLLAMASGARTATDIARRTGVSDRALQYYFKHLLELGYVRRRYPLDGSGKPAARHVRYDLDDPLLRFWFRFVYPNTSFILQAGGEKAYEYRIGPEIDSYYGGCFERLCRQALPFLYAREGVMAAFETGEYWDKESQIDVVGARDDGRIDLGECKWGTVRSWKAVEEELEEKVKLYPNARNATLQRRIFTRDPAPAGTARSPLVRWHSLADLYPAVAAKAPKKARGKTGARPR